MRSGGIRIRGGSFAAVIVLASAGCADSDDEGGNGNGAPGPDAGVGDVRPDPGPDVPPAPDAASIIGDGATPLGPGYGSATTPGAGTSLESAPCPFAPPPGRAVTCGVVTVPEDRARPDGRKVRLPFAIVRGPANGNTPLVYIEGGPGGSGLRTLAGRLPTPGNPFDLFAAERDVIVVDARGTGASLPSLDCPEYPDLPAPMDETRMLRGLTPREAASIAACRDRLRAAGVDLAQYTTAAQADDLEDVRRALGITSWDVLGVSYGTRVALELLRRHPAPVRSATIDSVLPPQVDAAAQPPVSIYRALSLLFERCAAQPMCQRAYPDLRTTLVQVLNELAATPVTLTLANGRRVRLDAEVVVQGIVLLLYDPEGVAIIPELVYQLRDRNYLNVTAGLASINEVAGGLAEGVYLSVICAEEAPFTSRAAIDAALESVPADLRPFLRQGDPLDACTLWNVPAAPAVANEIVRSDRPVLALAGELDPVTPPSFATETAAALSAAQVRVLPGLSHAVYAEACGTALVQAYLRDPAAPAGADCVSTLAQRPFLVAR